MTSEREVVLSSTVTMIEFCGACPVVMIPLSSNRLICSVASGWTFVEPPTKGWVGGDEFSGDWRPTVLAGIMLALFVITMIVPPLRDFFELQPLGIQEVGIIVAIVVVWAFGLRFIWRAKVLERLAGQE